jgi:hypothetical protein
MTQPLAPDRLWRLLDEAVRPVTPHPGTFGRICWGVRRRRMVRRAGVALLASLTIAGGSVTGLTLTLGSAPVMSAAAAGPDTVEQSASGSLDYLNPVTEGKRGIRRDSGTSPAAIAAANQDPAGPCRWVPPARPPVPSCPR